MINKKNLSPQLINWIMSQGIGPGVGDVFFLTPAESATAQFGAWMRYLGVPNGYYGSDLATMYAKMKEGRNDTLIVLPGAHAVTSAQTWDKRYTHVIGTHEGAMNQRARIVNSTVGVSPMITISDEGSKYANILFSQEGSHGTSCAINVYVTGHRPIFNNCGFRNIGALAVVNAAHRSLKIGSCYDITFRNCQIGETSYDAVTAASYVIEFSGTDAGKYLFYDCLILGAGSSSAAFIKQPANVGGFTLFKDTLFHNSIIGDLDAMSQAFDISGTGNDGVYLMGSTLVNGAGALETSNSGVLFGESIPAAATGNIAVALTY